MALGAPANVLSFSGKLRAMLQWVGYVQLGGVATVCTPSPTPSSSAAELLETVCELLHLVSGAQLQKLARFEALGRVAIA